MLESVKELLKGKGLLAELEDCRNEEEAIKVLKRENLWGIINYPELEELKESYKNGEIEADGTLSLNQLDKVAGGAKGVKSRHASLRQKTSKEEKIDYPGYLVEGEWEEDNILGNFFDLADRDAREQQEELEEQHMIELEKKTAESAHEEAKEEPSVESQQEVPAEQAEEKSEEPIAEEPAKEEAPVEHAEESEEEVVEENRGVETNAGNENPAGRPEHNAERIEKSPAEEVVETHNNGRMEDEESDNEEVKEKPPVEDENPAEEPAYNEEVKGEALNSQEGIKDFDSDISSSSKSEESEVTQEPVKEEVDKAPAEESPAKAVVKEEEVPKPQEERENSDTDILSKGTITEDIHTEHESNESEDSKQFSTDKMIERNTTLFELREGKLVPVTSIYDISVDELEAENKKLFILEGEEYVPAIPEKIQERKEIPWVVNDIKQEQILPKGEVGGPIAEFIETDKNSEKYGCDEFKLLCISTEKMPKPMLNDFVDDSIKNDGNLTKEKRLLHGQLEKFDELSIRLKYEKIRCNSRYQKMSAKDNLEKEFINFTRKLRTARPESVREPRLCAYRLYEQRLEEVENYCKECDEKAENITKEISETAQEIYIQKKKNISEQCKDLEKQYKEIFLTPITNIFFRTCEIPSIGRCFYLRGLDYDNMKKYAEERMSNWKERANVEIEALKEDISQEKKFIEGLYDNVESQTYDKEVFSEIQNKFKSDLQELEGQLALDSDVELNEYAPKDVTHTVCRGDDSKSPEFVLNEIRLLKTDIDKVIAICKYLAENARKLKPEDLKILTTTLSQCIILSSLYEPKEDALEVIKTFKYIIEIEMVNMDSPVMVAVNHILDSIKESMERLGFSFEQEVLDELIKLEKLRPVHDENFENYFNSEDVLFDIRPSLVGLGEEGNTNYWGFFDEGYGCEFVSIDPARLSTKRINPTFPIHEFLICHIGLDADKFVSRQKDEVIEKTNSTFTKLMELEKNARKRLVELLNPFWEEYDKHCEFVAKNFGPQILQSEEKFFESSLWKVRNFNSELDARRLKQKNWKEETLKNAPEIIENEKKEFLNTREITMPMRAIKPLNGKTCLYAAKQDYKRYEDEFTEGLDVLEGRVEKLKNDIDKYFETSKAEMEDIYNTTNSVISAEATKLLKELKERRERFESMTLQNTEKVLREQYGVKFKGHVNRQALNELIERFLLDSERYKEEGNINEAANELNKAVEASEKFGNIESAIEYSLRLSRLLGQKENGYSLILDICSQKSHLNFEVLIKKAGANEEEIKDLHELIHEKADDIYAEAEDTYSEAKATYDEKDSYKFKEQCKEVVINACKSANMFILIGDMGGAMESCKLALQVSQNKKLGDVRHDLYKNAVSFISDLWLKYGESRLDMINTLASKGMLRGEIGNDVLSAVYSGGESQARTYEIKGDNLNAGETWMQVASAARGAKSIPTDKEIRSLLLAIRNFELTGDGTSMIRVCCNEIKYAMQMGVLREIAVENISEEDLGILSGILEGLREKIIDTSINRQDLEFLSIDLKKLEENIGNIYRIDIEIFLNKLEKLIERARNPYGQEMQIYWNNIETLRRKIRAISENDIETLLKDAGATAEETAKCMFDREEYEEFVDERKKYLEICRV